MTGKKHVFDGQELTVAQIRERVPVLSASTIRDHLAKGRNTASAMLSFDARAASSVTGKRRNAERKAAGIWGMHLGSNANPIRNTTTTEGNSET